METLPRLSDYTTRTAVQKQAGEFMDYARSLAAGGPARIAKANVLPQTIGNTSGALIPPGVAFAQLVGRKTILGQLSGATIPMQPFQRLTGLDDVAVGEFIGEAQPAPLTKLDFSGPTLDATKLSVIVGLTSELLRFGADAGPLVERVILRALRLSEGSDRPGRSGGCEPREAGRLALQRCGDG